MPTKVDNRTRLEIIQSIHTLLEDASEIAANKKLGKNRRDDKHEIELVSLLYQILSLTISIRAGYFSENFQASTRTYP